MPRIYTSRSEPIDYCQDCFPHEAKAEEAFGDIGDGPDGRGNCFAYDAEHPDYEGDPFYKCETCGRQLTAADNDYF